jgi:alpha-1,4-N-acetylglucosaminyltransferase EXTL1
MQVMSAGAIPVILSDRWRLPFSEVIDYSSFAVLAKEHEIGTLEAELRAIPPEKVSRCVLRVQSISR